MNTIVARHMSADMYACKASAMADGAALQERLSRLMEAAGFHIGSFDMQGVSEDHTAVLLLLEEGHFAIHLFNQLRYVAVDIFLCTEGAAPEKLLQSLRDYFRPEKFRTTYLKRGDFKGGQDMKPQVKTHLAPLRRIHNTGAKVIRLLAHRRH
ncbi:MAG: S-adenosylmethionine decarboxylase [Schwartzia sp.]|nr:S-adenosylmethionine decarboxylase [Schwartzia sp. (in: firmicutes)]